jgi:hypothetical protein
MHLHECGGKEKGRNTHGLARLALPGQTGRGMVWRGEAMGAGA